MKISTKGRYGLRAMVDLTEHQNEGAIPLREISERQKISIQYLEQIFATLRKSDLVKSIRGVNGGYILNKSPEKITVGDIIIVLEGPLAPVDCLIENECDLIDDCVTHNVWRKVQNSIEDVLDSITLQQLKEESEDMS